MSNNDYRIAVLIPCHNEAAAIGKVVREFRAAVPAADIYVFDNNSTDETVVLAREAGAIVRHEPLQGKGHVVRRMFSDVEADIYVLVDGDDTYHAASAPVLIDALIDGHYDMVNAKRINSVQGAYRFGHKFGNRLLTGLVSWMFGNRIDDLLSGYRVFSRRFVKSFPSLSTGFETETELTVHALSLHIPTCEIETPYKERPEGGSSKLNTIADGIRIFRTILLLTKEERPLFFFGVGFVTLVAISLALGVPVIFEWLATGLVERFPTAILAASIMVLAFITLSIGILLSSVSRARREVKRLSYLSIPWLGRQR